MLQYWEKFVVKILVLYILVHVGLLLTVTWFLGKTGLKNTVDCAMCTHVDLTDLFMISTFISFETKRLVFKNAIKFHPTNLKPYLEAVRSQ